MTTLAAADEWADAACSPYRLVNWKECCSALDLSTNSLLRLCAEMNVPIVKMSTRKRSLLARDLVRIIRANSKPAASYATVQERDHV